VTDYVKLLREGALSGDLPLGVAFNWNEIADEIERLRKWKAEATAVLAAWDSVWEAAGRPGRLGSSKPEQTADEIARLRTAGQALYDVLDQMWKCGLRRDDVALAMDIWDGIPVAATPKEDDR
jgi:hypothetical protein